MNMSCQKIFFLISLFLFIPSSLFSNLKLDSFSFQNYYPDAVNMQHHKNQSWLKLDKSITHSYKTPKLRLDTSSSINTQTASSFITKNTPALAFPNPFRVYEGVEIGFYSSEAFNAQLYVYDMLGHLRIKRDIDVINTAYNIIELQASDFEGGPVSAGAYFYVIVRDSEIIRKGKMGIVP